MKIVIVGGAAGGVACAARLRRLDERNEIVLLEKEKTISFARCGFTHYLDSRIDSQSIVTQHDPQLFSARFRVDVRTESTVTAIDTANKAVAVEYRGESYCESYDKLVLAIEARPQKLDVPGIQTQSTFPLRSIDDADSIRAYMQRKKPRRVCIIGGGFAGLEMASSLANPKIEVVIMDESSQLLPEMDADVICELYPYLRRKGIHLRLGMKPERVQHDKDGLTIHAGNMSVKTDMIVLATGMTPANSLAKGAKLMLGANGLIRTDARMRTSDPSIYAIGDAVDVARIGETLSASAPMLSAAHKQGRVAADSIMGMWSRYEGTRSTAVLKLMDMTVAMTGLSEKAGVAVDSECEKSFTYTQNCTDHHLSAKGMSIKIVFSRSSGKLLGAQIVGFDGVEKQIDVLSTAIRLQATARDLTRLDLCHTAPFSPIKDPVNMAGYVVENVLDGRIKLFHWHDVDALIHREDVLLLDVRTPEECAHSAIEGFVNIPLDDLRARIAELSPDKPIYVYCHNGQRSYLACRMLEQLGFMCRNLSGGYRLYLATKGERLCG